MKEQKIFSSKQADNDKNCKNTYKVYGMWREIINTLYAKLVSRVRRIYLFYSNWLKKRGAFCFTHITYYACTNVGDTVLSAAVRKGFEVHFSDVSWRLQDVSKPVNNKYVSEFNRTDAVIIGGGGLFLPDTNENSVSGWQWACAKEQLIKIKKPIILYSIGFNFFRGQEPNELFISSLELIIRKSAFVGIRNYGSIREIKKLIPDDLHKKVVYQPCLTTLIRKIYKDLPPKRTGKKVAVNVAFDRLEHRFGANQEIILNQIASAVKGIEERGYEIYYISHIAKDARFLTYLDMHDVHYKSIIASSWSTKRTICFYNDMDFVLGMRGHAQMIPFGVNCQILTLGSHDKMKWFLEDIDALDWYVELTDNVSELSEYILNKFVEIHEIYGTITNKRLLQAQEKLFKITVNNFETIRSIVGEYGHI